MIYSIADDTKENDETVILDIESVTGGNEAGENQQQQVTLTIIDDDADAPRGFDDYYQVGQNSTLYVDYIEAGDQSAPTVFSFDGILGKIDKTIKNIIGY